MSKTLAEIARQLKDADKKGQLIYAFNGTGKTRLSREFKQLIAPKAGGNESGDEADQLELSRDRILYYNAFTEDLFYWDNDLALDAAYKLKIQDGTYQLISQPNDSPFSYHLYLRSELEKAIESGQVSKYHFNFLRNVLEKTCAFLGYKRWADLLPKTDDGGTNPYEARIINISSHSKHAGEEVADLTEEDKRVLRYLVRELNSMYRFR